MRSLLFVPGDSPRKLDKGFASGADCLLIDLEDAVAPDAKAAARATTRNFLATARSAEKRPRLYVRVNALSTGLTDVDLDAVVAGAPDGVMLPKSIAGADVQHLSVKLGVREAEHGLPDGSIRIIAIAAEAPESIFHLGAYAGASRRLAGLTWGPEDMLAAIGGETNRLPDGGYTPPYALARTLLLYAAATAEVAAIDTIFGDFRNAAGLRQECEIARRDGFTGKMAIHPDQVAVINEVFTPGAKAVAEARAIVAAFAANPGAGVLAIDGKMYDRPHLTRAERLLARM